PAAVAARPLRHRHAEERRAAAALRRAAVLAPGVHRGAHALREGDAPLMAEVSTKPYLVRAIYEWCADNGYRPFIAVAVDERTLVPREFVRNGEIVLNISAEATNRLHIGNELLEFEARFSGAARHVSIPIDNLSAIFAEENGRGMAFEVPSHAREADDEGAPDEAHGSASQAKHEAHDGAQDASGPALESVAPAPADEGGARPENQAKKPAEEAPATSAKRAGSGRAPK